jgi:nucleoside-triphosphatase
MGVLIVSGGRGEGKTTFLSHYASRLADSGRSVGGIISPAVFEAEKRIGYDLIDLRDGTRHVLARLAGPDEKPTVGVYRFDPGTVTAGVAAVSLAVRNGLDLIAIDEVGPLEFRGDGWATALIEALRCLREDQTLVITVRPALVDQLPVRFPSPAWVSAERVTPPWPAVTAE